MNSTKNTLGTLIDLAIKMEQTAYEFYDNLEQHFLQNESFVGCLSGIKEDELLHLRVLTEIKASLNDVRLASLVKQESIDKVEHILDYMDTINVADLKTGDEVVEAIRTLENAEFDIVMEFVDADEINFEFTREYLKNESIDHTNRIYKAQQCLD